MSHIEDWLRNLKQSITGDIYMGEDWEIATINEIQKAYRKEKEDQEKRDVKMKVDALAAASNKLYDTHYANEEVGFSDDLLEASDIVCEMIDDYRKQLQED